MIKIENIIVPSIAQIKFIIEGMRNPMNSWDRSDSIVCSADGNFYIGGQDYELMRKLAIAGTEHRKFMRMMMVGMRIEAPLYWWKEFDTYKVGTVTNSCSTMHKITAERFSLSDFSHERLRDESIEHLQSTINLLNKYRDMYLESEELSEYDKKQLWWQIIQLLPSSYNQTRNVMLNYEVLANIYQQRRKHKLDEWIVFCRYIREIPYSSIIKATVKN